MNLEFQRSVIRPEITVHKGAETIQVRKLFKGGNYTRKYGRFNFVHELRLKINIKRQRSENVRFF